MILSAAVLTLAMASCTDLDVDIVSQYTEKPATEEAVEGEMSNIYFKFRGPLGRRYMEAMTLTSDEYTSLAYSGNWVDGYAYAHPSYHAQTSEDATVDWMGELGKANVLASEIANSGYPEAARIGARAMRAFFTFIIMENWGDAPLPDMEYCQEMGFDTNNRVARAEVAKYIEKELLEIAEKLPEATTGDNYGKPNKYMAYALLAKLYINWPVYTAEGGVANYDANNYAKEKLQACIDACDKIISSNKFALGPDEYRFKFNWDNTERVEAGTIKDFIYVAPYDTKEAQGMQWGRSHVYKDVKKMKTSYFGEFLNNSGGAYMTLTPECVSHFNLKGDQRNWMIAGLCDKDGKDAEGQVYVYDPTTLLPTETKALDRDNQPLIFTKSITVTGDLGSNDVGDDKEGWRQGYRSTKWFLCNNDYSNGRNQSNDVPIFRYADVLLTKAEAMVRNGQSGAKDLVNQIRKYVKAEELTAEPTLNDVYDERGRELFDELWRRNDMIRYGHYEDEFFPHYKSNPNANFDKTHRIFPIAKGDLDLNPGWSQNSGY